MADVDELADINGIKPNQVIKEGDEVEAKSMTSKTVYKVKRTFDHYYCTCPAWRNQSGAPVNARSCKHIRSLLGDAYEDARLLLKNPDGPPPKPKPAPKTAKKTAPAKAKAPAKPPAKVKPKKDEDNDEEMDEDEEPAPPPKARTSSRRGAKAVADDGDKDGDEATAASKDVKGKGKGPASRVRKPVEDDTNGVPARRTSGRRGAKAEPEPAAEDEGAEAKDDAADGKAPPPAVGADADELAVIDGIKPKVVIKDGEEIEAKSQTSNSVYKVKRTWDHYYCTCPAWRNQGGLPVNARSCKHLRLILGDKYEDARLKMKNPHGPASKSAKKPASKAKGKRKKDDNDDGDDAKATKKPRSSAKAGDDEAEDDEEDDDDEDAPASKKKAPDVLLATKWDLESGPDPTGWWISEKLDGVRTIYDGKQMLSRLGNPFTPPKWLLEKLPKDMTLDGELFGGRGEFQSTVSIVKTVNSPHWQNITFQIFDIPSRADEPFEDRLAFLLKTFGPNGTHASGQIEVVQHEEAKSRDHVLEKLKEIEGLGGEGLMLRKPGSLYEGKRSGSLQKVKTFFDAEAIVTGYVPGKGQHKGATGALKCEMESGKKFNVGSGLNHQQRQKPPKVGSIVTYRFQELTRDGVPRFPTFVGEAIDKDEAKDAEVPAHRKGTAAKADA